MADEESTINIKLGGMVSIKDIEKPGKVAFIGTTKFKEGKWVGIILDYPGGKNDGTVQGVKYFDCLPNHGIFVKPHMIKPVEDKKAAASPSNKAPAITPAKKSVPNQPSPAAPPPPEREKPATPSGGTEKPAAPSGGIAGLKSRITELEQALELANRKLLASGSAEVNATEGMVYAQEKKLLGEIEVLTSTNEKLAAELKITKAKLVELEPMRGFKSKNEELAKQLKVLTSDRELSNSKIQALELEWDCCKQELIMAQEDLEMAQKQTTEQLQVMISQLPTGEAEVARIGEENRQLSDALRKLRDQHISLQSKYDTLKQETDSELEELRSKAILVDSLEEECSGLKEALAEMRSLAEENSSVEAMLETLSGKNLELQQQCRDHLQAIESQKELIRTHDEIEEGHLEYESQLSAEISTKEVELQEAHRQLKQRQSQIDDLNASNRSFRALVKDLENDNHDLLSVQSLSEDEKVSQRKGRQGAKQHSLLAHEVRYRALENLKSKLEARTSSLSFEYLKQFVPDNVSISEGSLQLMLKVDRLCFKSSQGAKLLAELYLSGKPDRIASAAFEICEKLVSLAQSCNRLAFGTRLAPPSTLDNMVAEKGSLDGADEALDLVLDLISKDEVIEGASLEALNTAQENVLGFLEAHYNNYDPGTSMGPGASKGSLKTFQDVATFVNRGPPVMVTEVTRISLLQSLAVSKLDCIGEVLASFSGEGPAPNFSSLFQQLEGLQNSNKELSVKILTAATSYEIMVGSSETFDPKHLEEDISLCLRYARGSVLRLKELLDWMESMAESRPLGSDNAAAEAKWRASVVAQFEGRFEVEAGESRLLTELQSMRSTLEGLFRKLEASSPPVSDKLARPVWETRAQEVRGELMQAASLKMALEDAVKKLDAKTAELFAAKKLARDTQSKVDVLSAKVTLLQTKTNEVDDIAIEAERLRRKVKEFEASSEAMSKDMEKYSNANTALHKKNLTLKYELKRTQEQRQAPASSSLTTSSGKHLPSLQAAAEEISLMGRTVALLRHQLTLARATQGMQKVASLPPLLQGGKALSLHSATASLAAQSALEASSSPFVGASDSASELSSLRAELQGLSLRARSMRSAPCLVDLSQASASQQWLTSQGASNKLASDTQAMRNKLDSFFASDTSCQAFRALLSFVPSKMGNSIAADCKLVARLALPMGVDSSAKVVLKPSQLQELHSVLVK